MKTFKLSNIEVSEEEIRKVIRENPELVKEVGHKRKFFNSKEGDMHYKITDTCFYETRNYGTNTDKSEIERGVYKTKEEAELADRKRIALVRVWNYADDNVPFTPDWSTHEYLKYFVSYCHSKNMFEIESRYNTVYTTFLPHFKSKEDADKFITACENDLKILFDIK